MDSQFQERHIAPTIKLNFEYLLLILLSENMTNTWVPLASPSTMFLATEKQVCAHRAPIKAKWVGLLWLHLHSIAVNEFTS